MATPATDDQDSRSAVPVDFPCHQPPCGARDRMQRVGALSGDSQFRCMTVTTAARLLFLTRKHLFRSSSLQTKVVSLFASDAMHLKERQPSEFTNFAQSKQVLASFWMVVETHLRQKFKSADANIAGSGHQTGILQHLGEEQWHCRSRL